MEKKNNSVEEKKEWYQYREFPKNVRQIGVPLPGQKVYLEDYVITYLKQQFMHAEEPVVILLLGTQGEEQVKESVFVYGAVVLEQKGVLMRGALETQEWSRVRETVCRAFPGAQILGWACGVPMWNSSVDSCVRRLQKKEFRMDGSILFLWDLSEKEEKLFLWQKGMLQEQSGYYVYFAKNPQMQEFMLGGGETESIDAAYDDGVTVSMRQVIEKKEERKKNLQLLSWCGAVAAGIALLFGIHTMLDSTQRIQEMEQTVDTLTEYVGKQQEEVETISQKAGQAVAQITFQPTRETAQPAVKGQESEETGASAGTEKSEETGASAGTEKSEETGASAGAEKSEETGASAGTEKSEETGASAGTKKSEETGASAGTEKSEETDASAGTEKSEETGAASVRTGRGRKANATQSRSSETASSSVRTTQQSYIVRKGDTLSQIVWRQYHDMSYEKKVKKRNGLQSADEIYQGQCLILPEYKK